MNRNCNSSLHRCGVYLRVRAMACAFILLCGVFAPTVSNALMDSCISKAELAGLASCGTSPCVCPTGATGYTCPSGWTESGGTCTRSQGTGSDVRGTYTVTYGSCAATTINCYMLSSTDMGTGCLCLDCG